MALKFFTDILVFFVFLVAVAAYGCTSNDAEQPVFYPDLVSITYAEDSSGIQDWPDQELKLRFARYWHYRLAGDTLEAWKMEAPYFQFMFGQDRYRAYIGTSQARIDHIEIYDINQVSDFKFHILSNIEFTRSEESISVSINDRWIKLDYDWYHVIKDPLISSVLY